MFRLDAEKSCLLEVFDGDLDAEGGPTSSEGTMEINLRSLSGTFNPQAIRLQGAIQGHQIFILVDSWSTHNFIQGAVAEKLGIGTQKVSEFQVYIGSGEFMLCSEVCRQVPVVVQGMTIVQDLFVLVMEGANVVFSWKR